MRPTDGAKRHVAFIPLKIDKNKSYCVLAHVSRLFIFYFLGGVRWIVNNFICVYQVYGVYLYCN